MYPVIERAFVIKNKIYLNREICSVILIMVLSSPSLVWSEECLDLWAVVKWNGLPVEVISVSLPMTTKGPKSFVGGKGFDFYARFETERNSDGKVVLKSSLSGTKDDCKDKSTVTNTLEKVAKFDAGYIICGHDQFHLILDYRGISGNEKSCW